MEHNGDDEWRQKDVWNIGIVEKGRKRAADRELTSQHSGTVKRQQFTERLLSSKEAVYTGPRTRK